MARVGRLVKEAIVTELGEQLSQRPNFFVTAVNRLSAPDADALRLKLSASQARLFLVNRRLGLRAVEPLKITGLSELLDGSIGLILSGGDVLPTAKLIVEFRKSHEERVAVKGAVIDGQLLDSKRVEELASLPPKPILLAQVVATIEAPMADVIFTIERLIGDIAWLAEQAAEKKLTEAGTTPQAGSPKEIPNATGGGTETTTTTEPTKEGT